MSLKKRMIRSNLAMLAAAFVILLAATCGVALLFKGKFSREMESLEYTQLNENVVTIAGLMDQAGQTDDETLAENLGTYGYRLVVIEDGKSIYGSGREDAKEILNHFNFDAHRAEETEVYYSQGMTIVGRHLTSTNTYFFAIDGEEMSWWITPIRHSLSTFFYALCVLGVITATALLFLSVFFTRSMLRKIIMPLEALEKGADRIQQGELSIPVMYHGDEEFEKVCRTFNEMQSSILENREQRRRDEQARIDMVTGISHDLRTPLTSIQGYLKGVLDGVADTKEKEIRYLETAYESTKEMNILLQKLFDFSRMESGQLRLNRVDVDLAELVDMFLAKKEREPGSERYRFAFRKTSEVFPEVSLDVDQVRRILENLLENSMKYSGNIPAEINVNIYQTEKTVCLEWADHGVGVPEDKIGKIFDKFYRCDESRSKKGSGVGLYLVKWIMEQHGGCVEAENRDGLLIRLEFPKKKERTGKNGKDTDSGR